MIHDSLPASSHWLHPVQDGSGEIDRKEFRRAIRKVGFDVGDEELDALFGELDPDGSGSIDFRELNQALRQGAQR